MPSEYRRVTLAAGDAVVARLSPRQSGRPGCITLVRSHRPPFDVEARRWAEAESIR